jgi:hypothetical protein
VPRSLSDHVRQLVDSLYEKRSVLGRFRGQNHLIDALAQIAAAGEINVVPDIFPLVTNDDALSPHAARTIAELVRGVDPNQLASLDVQMRPGYHAHDRRGFWQTISPDAVRRLAEIARFDPCVVGLIASHSSGFVRAAALELLAESTSGDEIPFLALRANDWVAPVAARARELLLARLRPDNRRAVLDAFPFIVRVIGKSRRDHAEIERALRAVLLSDGGQDAIVRAAQCDTPTRRKMYELLTADGPGPAAGPGTGTGAELKRRFVSVSLNASDVVLRTRAIRFIAADVNFEDRVSILERLLRDDPVAAVRGLTLAVISEHMPERIAGYFPDVLLDRSASVRGLARFFAQTHRLPIVPRDVYGESLATRTAHPRQISAAIEGIGETGTRADADSIASFLSAPLPRHRRSALRALAWLDTERAISSAITALGDGAPSVRAMAIDILSNNAISVDFDVLKARAQSITNHRVRRDLLGVFAKAPKWEAAAFLLEAVADADADEGLRAHASSLVDRWVEGFNRNQTQPTANQLQRIRTLSDAVAPRMSAETAKTLRLSLG